MRDVGAQRSRVIARLVSVSALALLALLSGCIDGAIALVSPADKVVRYHGYRVVVPAGWPVFNLTSDPTVCVRFDRHAVYLGQPSPDQRCPAHAVGRTEAILIQPLAAHSTGFRRGVGTAVLPVTRPDAQPGRGSLARRAIPARGVIVTATWRTHPGVIRPALGVHSLGVIAADARSAPRRPAVGARSAGALAGAGAIFTGLGFDACSAPSQSHMSAWSASPYRAIGVYIGGTNMGCSQPSLTASWVSAESAAGWRLIPTYVGLQAPSNSCGCASIAPSHAFSEGTAAAVDAVAQARALGIGAGNPIYFDMEAYNTGGSSTPAVLAFLAAWTSRLHAYGYASGIYSSAASGISDLVARVGTGYTEPDDLWIADWNGRQTTSDPYVPSGDWPLHRRLHQYSGAHNETYGGATINIDGDYLDGATAGAATAVTPILDASPTLSVSPGGDGTIRLYASWNGAIGVAAWRVLAGASPGALAPVGAAKPGARAAIGIHSSYPYFAVQALGSAGQVLGASQAVATPAYIALYGRRAFVPRLGLVGVPGGCFTINPCHMTITISAGRTRLASTSQEFIPAGGGALLYFKLSPAGRAKLARAHGHRLPVRVTARDASGATATTTLNLIAFLTNGPGPRRSITNAQTLRIISSTDFVFPGEVGGILAGCFNTTPCHVTTTITARRTTIARTGPEVLGANELGYLMFTLSPQGSSMLARAQGNQLAAHVTITNGTAAANAAIALVKLH